MTVEEAADVVREKLDVDEEELSEIDEMLLVKIYNESFDRGYQQGFKEKEMISKSKLRFRDYLLAKFFRKIRYLRMMGVLNILKFKFRVKNSAGGIC